MQYYYHEQLTNMDDTGFGVIYIDKSNPYVPAHWHQAVELLLFVKGHVTCKFSHSSFKAGPGDVYLVNSHDVHETRCTRNAKYLCVHILPSAMCKYVSNFDLLNFSLKFDPDHPVLSKAYEDMKLHMEQIMELHQSTEDGANLEIRSHLFALAAILVKYFSRPMALEESKGIRSDMTRLEPLLEYTQIHHTQPLTLDDAANFMGLNREYFCRLFKKNMGISYLTYLNQVRATAVCRELEASDDPIGEIGERHGFTSPKMMNQYFRELFGCTPSEKRKSFREMISDGIY